MGCKQSSNINQSVRPTKSLWADDDKNKKPGKQASFKMHKSITSNPKHLASIVKQQDNRDDTDGETIKTQYVDFEAELAKFGPKLVKDKTLKIIEQGTSAVLILVTLEEIEYGIEWKSEELKVVSRKDLQEKIVKKVEQYHDDLHQFLLQESPGYKEAQEHTSVPEKETANPD